MKKLLALVLALVMSMSLVTISNAAYSDAADIDYTEAVDVMSAVGVLEGSDNKFDPNDTLTREQAAKIICYMLLGKKVAEKLTVSSAPFADVAADRWSAPYIAYCVANKIVDGIGDGKFDPAGKLTGHAFGKMLLTALDVKGEYTGASWAINVAAALVKNELDDGVESLVLSKELTRQEAAQLAFNAVKFNGTEKVYGVDTNSDGVADVTFDDRTDALLYASANAGATYLGKVENVENSLLDEVFKVSVTTGADKFGRVATVYSNNDWDDDLTVAEAAKYTFTASKTYNDFADADDMNAAINKELNITADAKKLVYSNGDVTKINNVASTSYAGNTFKKGDKVEIYMNGDSKTDIASVVIVRYELVKVTNIQKLSAATIKANSSNADSKIVNAKSTITMKTPAGVAYTLSKSYDTQIPGFAYEKNDFVLVAKNASTNVVLDSMKAETVSGTINTTKGSKVGIDGTYYEVAATGVDYLTTAINTKGTWALNASGALGADIDVTEYTEDFIYIYSINKKTTTDDGLAGNSYVAYGVDNKGVKVSYTLATVDGTAANSVYIKGGKDVDMYKLSDLTYDGTLASVNVITAYKINKDNKLEIADSKLTVGTVNNTNDVSKSSAVVGTNKFATADTQFIFKYGTTSVKTKVIVGYKNVNIDASATNYYAVTNSDNKAVYVFVIGDAAAVDASVSAIFAVKDGGYVYKKDADSGDETFVYTFLTADGDKVVEATDKNNTVDGYAYGTVFAYSVNSDGEIEIQTRVAAQTNITFVSGTQIQTASGVTLDTDGLAIYTVTKHTDSETVEVTAGGEFQADDNTADGYYVQLGYDKAVGTADAKVTTVFILNSVAD